MFLESVILTANLRFPWRKLSAGLTWIATAACAFPLIPCPHIFSILLQKNQPHAHLIMSLLLQMM